MPFWFILLSLLLFVSLLYSLPRHPSPPPSLPPSRCWSKQNKVEHCFLSLLYLVFAFMWINSLSLVFLYLFSLSGELAVGRPSRHQETTRAESSLGESAGPEGGDSESELTNTNTQQISQFLRCATAVWGSAPHGTPITESKQTLAINLKHKLQFATSMSSSRAHMLLWRSSIDWKVDGSIFSSSSMSQSLWGGNWTPNRFSVSERATGSSV